MAEPLSPPNDSDSSTKLDKGKYAKDAKGSLHFHYRRKSLDFTSDVVRFKCYNDQGELNLSNQCLKDLSSLKDRFHSGLEKINLSGCGLTQFPEGLDVCVELEEVNLSNNPLGDSDTPVSSFLESLPKSRLKKLNLSDCGLKQFQGSFHFGPLEELNLSNNPLGHLSMSFSSSVGLALLRKLIGHSGKSILDLDLTSLMWLKKLNLSDCGFKTWPLVVHQVINLEELNLSNNFINHQHIFENLPSSLSLQKPGNEQLEPTPIGLGFFVARKIIFEDAVYVHVNGGSSQIKAE